jgi:hypothetical protein
MMASDVVGQSMPTPQWVFLELLVSTDEPSPLAPALMSLPFMYGRCTISIGWKLEMARLWCGRLTSVTALLE